MFDIEGFRRQRHSKTERNVCIRCGSFSYFLAADFIPPSIESTTFEVRDRPYATILKSVPSHPCYTRTYPDVSPRRSQELAGRFSFQVLELCAWCFDLPVPNLIEFKY